MDEVKRLAEKMTAQKQKLGVAESCTGGFLSNWITDLPGASQFFERGVVVYSNDSKKDLLGVSEKTLHQFGAVSEEAAKEMAQGVLKKFPVDAAVAITGIAGPEGGTPEKPVGTVFIACISRGKSRAGKFCFIADRQNFKRKTAEAAVRMLLEIL